jgi:hypothetical protein
MFCVSRALCPPFPRPCVRCVSFFTALSQFTPHHCVVGVSLFQPCLCARLFVVSSVPLSLSCHFLRCAPVPAVALFPSCSCTRHVTVPAVLLCLPCSCARHVSVSSESLCHCVCRATESFVPYFCRVQYPPFTVSPVPLCPFFPPSCRYWNLTTVTSSLTCTDQDHFHVQAESDSTWIRIRNKKNPGSGASGFNPGWYGFTTVISLLSSFTVVSKRKQQNQHVCLPRSLRK